MPTESKELTKSEHAAYAATVGIVVGIAFHPIDRGIHLAISNHRAFLSWTNFTKPLHAVEVAMTFKPLTTGAFLFSQTMLREYAYPVMEEKGFSPRLANLLIGGTAGAIEGVLKNIPNATKSYTWMRPASSAFPNMMILWRLYGLGGFYRGLGEMFARDFTQGAVYEASRWGMRGIVSQHVEAGSKREVWNFTSDATAAFIATVVAAPFNYVRVVKQNREKQIDVKPIGFCGALQRLYSDTAKTPTFFGKAKFLAHSTQIGPGVLRMMAEMSTRQWLLMMLPVFVQQFKSYVNKPSSNDASPNAPPPDCLPYYVRPRF